MNQCRSRLEMRFGSGLFVHEQAGVDVLRKAWCPNYSPTLGSDRWCVCFAGLRPLKEKREPLGIGSCNKLFIDNSTA